MKRIIETKIYKREFNDHCSDVDVLASRIQELELKEIAYNKKIKVLNNIVFEMNNNFGLLQKGVE